MGLLSSLPSLITLGILKTLGFNFHLDVDDTQTFLFSPDLPCSPGPAPYLRLKLSTIKTDFLLHRRPPRLPV